MIIEALEKAWLDQAEAGPLSPLLAFGPEGLTLGAGTVLAQIDALDDAFHDADAQTEAPLCALLSAAYRQATSPTAVRHIRRGASSWRAGDTAMAAMHLAMTGFLPLRDVKGASRRLFMADALMKAGADPDTILRALDLPVGDGDGVLTRYDPDQPRNPAGSGRVSGRWASGDGAGASQAANPRPEPRATPGPASSAVCCSRTTA